MAEQKSIVLAAVILAMAVAGGAFYFFTGTSDEEQLDESRNEAATSQEEVAIGEELAAQLDGAEAEAQLSEGAAPGSEGALSLAEEQINESKAVDDDITADEPAVLGAETVEPTAETGVSGAMILLMGLAAALGFTGLAAALRKQKNDA